MQTFLPSKDFLTCAQILDRQRLGKQRVECLQILNALLLNGGWSNHPATKMWKGYEHALAEYAIIICGEWTNRGYKDTCALKILNIVVNNLDSCFEQVLENDKIIYPPWLGDDRLHSSHRLALLCKDHSYYKDYQWQEEAIMIGGGAGYEYFWPSLSRDFGGTGDGILRK